jgi:PKD repeat protein
MSLTSIREEEPQVGDPVTTLQQHTDDGRRSNTPLKLVKESSDQTQQTEVRSPNRALRITLILCSVFFVILTFLALSIFGNDNYYTIRKGENAFTVAQKFNVPLDILLKLNELTNPQSIKEGSRIKIPTTHDVHTVKEGDTLYSIARLYGIKRYDLVKYNRINGVRKLKTGERVFIPRILTDIQISVDNRTGLVPFSVRFNIDTNTRDRIRSYRWQLGDNTVSTNRNPTYTYKEKGTYNVSLTVIDENGNEVKSNTIPVVARCLAHIGFNSRKYVTLNKNDVFSLETKVIDNLNNTIEFNYQTDIEQNPRLVRQIDKTDRFEIISTGYSKVTFRVKGYEHTSYFFVSPIPSKHVPEPDLEWYRTQFNTGLNGNCGPACIAMGIQWSTGANIGVKSIRSQIGMPSEDGAIGYNHMIGIFNKYKTGTALKTIGSAGEIFRVIDNGNIVIVLVHSGNITKTSGNKQKVLFDRYYDDSVGHYIIVKGYSLNKEYFVTYDPIPGDWWLNSVRYSDGVSMIGKNRYYSVKEIFEALKTPTILVISQEKKKAKR